MDKETRNRIQKATQAARALLEQDFEEQLAGVFDIRRDGTIAEGPGGHLDAAQRIVRGKLVAAIRHRSSVVGRQPSVGDSSADDRRPTTEDTAIAVSTYRREAAFTTLNRFVALKMLEARGLVQECISRGEQSSGFREFCGLAPGLVQLPDRGYRLYIESLFDEIGREVRVLFDRRDPASLLWPARATLFGSQQPGLLEILNDPELAGVWDQDETIGWVYQYYNDPSERKRMRDESAAPRNSRELAVRNQFFTPRYVVEFLTDNSLGRTWYEMTQGHTRLKDRCRYLIRGTDDVFLNPIVDIERLDGLEAALRQGTLPAFNLDDPPARQRLWDFAVHANAYLHGRDGNSDWFERSLGALREGRWGDLGTQEIWDALFLVCRGEHFDPYSKDSETAWFAAAANEIRRRLIAGTTSESSDRPTQLLTFRRLRDPRTLKLIDPACGSMHFGLYAFDLFLDIYREAWAWEQCHGFNVLQRGGSEELKSLTETYADEAAFLRDVPRLILENNLHGIDIDPRAAQIAGLALWLRAQRAWQGQGVQRQDRPRVRRSNIVCAEPMPGEGTYLDEFIAAQLSATPEDRLLGQLVRRVFDAMRLAGEAGSLLKIEDEISAAVQEAKQRKLAGPTVQLGLFGDEPRRPEQLGFALDLGGITDERFWVHAEGRIYDALRAFAEGAGASYQRRLFVDDAARGFAFIDLCRQRYDVVLMNPPFGDASLPSKPYIEETYGDTKGDVYKAFVECFQARLVPAGYLGIISSRTGFFLGQSEDWRTRVVLRLYRPICLADLGSGVLDAMVEVAAYVLRSLSEAEARDLTLSLVPVLNQVVRDKQDRFSLPKWQAARDGLKRHQAFAELEHLEAHGFIKRSPGDIVRYAPLWQAVKMVSAPPEPVFPPLVSIRVLGDADKGAAVLCAANARSDLRRFVSQPADFAVMPATPFSYWVPAKVRRVFSIAEKFETEERTARRGPCTSNDFRLLRLWWEVNVPDITRQQLWVPFAKGGASARFYADQSLLVAWEERRFTFQGFLGRPGRWIERLESSDCFFRPGITWPLRAASLSPQVLPAGCVFSARGYAAFAPDDQLHALLGLMASRPFDFIFKSVLGRFGFPEFVVGMLQQLPLPDFAPLESRRIGDLVHRAWFEKRTLDAVNSISHAFLVPALLTSSARTLAERTAVWADRLRRSEETVAAIQDEIDDLAFRLYGLDAEDRAALTATLATEAIADAAPETDQIGEDEADEIATADSPALTADLVAYALGCAFGRWDIRYATGERPAPEASEPFAPLPACPPGQLQNAQGLPAGLEDLPASYPIEIPWDGILVDDTGHDRDLVTRGRRVFDVVFADGTEAAWQEAGEILQGGGDALRPWFARSCFADHIKRYSKSRRKAPIYWQLATPSASYSVWLYYDRFTKDTFYKVLNDFVTPKLQHEERKLVALVQDGGANPTGGQRTEIAEQEGFVAELRAFRAEVARVAPLWNPDLNDGVIINFAPLWRLVPQHRTWQKECKECWDRLAAGDYDWAHLAMHLWPERVVPKCVTDRSLAIAHGLEADLWEEGADGKWHPRAVPRAELERLVGERTSPAVKDALRALLEAPAPVAARGGGRRSTSTGSSRRAAATPRTNGGTGAQRAASPAGPDGAALESVRQAIAAAGGSAGKAEVLAATGLTDAQWNLAIAPLLAAGTVTKTGAARGTRYHLVNVGDL